MVSLWLNSFFGPAWEMSGTLNGIEERLQKHWRLDGKTVSHMMQSSMVAATHAELS
jgi:hypothetical protein